MFGQLFSDERFRPDQIKFYPTVVTRGSLLYQWWQSGQYQPYEDEILKKLIIDCKKVVPPYVRIMRLIRDIPGESIVAGNKITNLRQVMRQRGAKCDCIRCRESRDKLLVEPELKTIRYKAAEGDEYFFEFSEKDGSLYGFCRLRLPLSKQKIFADTAMIRELHVYGQLVSVGQESRTQHAGLGKRLLAIAEQTAKEAGFEKITVISGVGVREYYKKFGYKDDGTYMSKQL
jgi:elongator complex protein 3